MIATHRQLEIVRAVMRSGSVTDAAAFLGISQPAVSMVIGECEQRVGFKLFSRRQGRLKATKEALALLPELERIFTGIERVQELAQDLREARVGLIRIAANAAMMDSLLPTAIRLLRSQHPEIQVAIQTMLSQDVVEEVAMERVDLGLAMSPEDFHGNYVVDVCNSELVCIVPDGHPLANRKTISPAALSKYPFISYSRNLPLGASIDEVFRRVGVRRRIAIEVGPSATACALVRMGVGCAVVDPFVLTGHAGAGVKKIKLMPSKPVAAHLLLPSQAHVGGPTKILIGKIREAFDTAINDGGLWARMATKTNRE